MKHAVLGAFILALSLFGCNRTQKQSLVKNNIDSISKNTTKVQTNAGNSENNKSDTGSNKDQIQRLIRTVLLWDEAKKAPDLTPEIIDTKDSLCIGFDDEKIKSNMQIFKSTGYFSTEFIDNYYHIIQTLEKEMKDKKIAPYDTRELPPFNFANDFDPWCDCQDVPYDKPDSYSLVEVHIVNINDQEGKLYWTWGQLKPDNDSSWREFKYKIRVKKEENKWKISYLEGFDFEQSIGYVK